MNATPALHLLREARTQGVALWVEGANVKFEGPAHAVHALLPELREHKAELMALLAGGAMPVAEPDPPNPAPYLPPPWDAIRDRICQGWRAEFAPPGPDGKQAVTWIPPGQWDPEDGGAP